MLEELKKAYEKLDVRCVEEDDPAYLTYEQNEARAEFFIRSYAAMPALLEAVELLRRKMNPFTNNQATHDKVLALLERLETLE